MIGTALKSFAAQHRLAVNAGMVYGYLQGSFITLTEGLFYQRMSIYVGCVDAASPDGETLAHAAKCAEIILEMIHKASGEANIYALRRTERISAVVVNHDGSVVTVNFRKDAEGMTGLQRFTAELLPQITPLTAPLQCFCCGGHTQGQGYPVRIAEDTVVPMHPECLNKTHDHKGSKLPPAAPVIGATIGALFGAVVWAIISHAGYISALGALVILMLTLGGYLLLGGKPGKLQAITLVSCMVLAILLGTIGEFVWTLHEQYVAYGSVVNSMMSEAVYMRVSIKAYLTDAAALTDFLINLGIGLLFAPIVVGAFVSRKSCAPAQSPRALPGKA